MIRYRRRRIDVRPRERPDHQIARVVIDPQKIEAPHQRWKSLVDVDHPGQDDAHAPQRHGVEERLVVEAVGGTGHQRVDRVAGVGVEDAQVLRDPDPRRPPVTVGVGAVGLAERARHETVRAHERGQHQRRATRIAHARRPLRRQVALGHQHVRLVDGAPPVDQIAERRPRAPGERRQRRRRAGPLPAAARRDPSGEREVIERDHRRDVGRAQRREHLPVARGGRPVPGPLRRLEAAPFDPHPVDVGAQQLQRRQVRAPEIPRVGGARGARPVGDVRRPVGVAPLLPGGPIVVVSPFDLVGRRGRPQEKPRRRAGEHPMRGDRARIEGERFAAARAGRGQRGKERPGERTRAASQRAIASQM